MSRALREVVALVAVAMLLLAAASTANAAKAGDITLNGTRMLTGEKSTVTTTKLPNGAKRLKYEIGPFKIIPGQNEIGYTPITAKPQVDGYITRMRPDLIYMNGTVPRVDVVHLHHGVWVNLSRQNATNNLPELFFAAGEEKTIFQLPKGYGYRYEASDNWLFNHMIHNLTPTATQVKMVYEIDFIPDSSPAAAKMKPARPIWMDVESGKIYPVFNVMKNSGKNNLFTYPNDDPNAYPAGTRQRNAWTADRDGVLLATAGHLHPGGLHTDLWLERNGAKVRAAKCGRFKTAKAAKKCLAKAPRGRGDKVHLFRSKAKYYEPAGAVSWDVAMSATRPNWKVAGQEGRRAHDHRHLRHQARRVVGVDGDHGRLHGRRGEGEKPLPHARRPARQAHARPPAGEPQPRRQEDEPARRTQAEGRRGESRVRRHPRLQLPARRPAPARRGRASSGDHGRASR